MKNKPTNKHLRLECRDFAALTIRIKWIEKIMANRRKT
jgi:hypothetical protein